jgi:hypothetical protein
MTIPRMALAVATAFMILGMVPTGAEASCARWGETGYHYTGHAGGLHSSTRTIAIAIATAAFAFITDLKAADGFR